MHRAFLKTGTLSEQQYLSTSYHPHTAPDYWGSWFDAGTKIKVVDDLVSKAD